MDTVDELIGALMALTPEQRALPPFMTNGDLPDVPVGGVSVTARPDGYGQAVVISR